MPHWEGIEDTSATPAVVWLSRKEVTDGSSSTAPSEEPWKPLRKVDCQALNDSPEDVACVYVDGGRGKADKIAKKLYSNFIPSAPVRTLTCATWFVVVKDEKSSKDRKTMLLDPVPMPDAEKIEQLYQKAVKATSSLGKGIESVLTETDLLSDGTQVSIQKTGEVLTLRKKPTTGWFTSSQLLQRGYGAYQVPGEDLETQLGSVPEHLIFIVHGIGEAYFSREDVNVPTLIDSTNALRMDLQRKQFEQFQKQKQQSSTTTDNIPSPPGRVEVIPIEWYNHIHDSSSSLMKSLSVTTLTTIPALRAIANDVVFDVLMYMTPAFCESVLRTVTQQIQQFYDTFRKIHPQFHGTVTLIGHSLGSVICWDLLTLLQRQQQEQQPPTTSTSSPTLTAAAGPTGYELYAQKEHADIAQNGSWGPPIPIQPDSIFPTLPFTPEHTIFLGSPLGIFLTLRGAHPVFESLRNSSTPSPVSSFTLPTQSVFNIFHPSDPVAYRIEPLLLPQDMDPKDLPPPAYLTVPGQDVRLHVKAKQMSDVIKKSLFDATKKKTSSSTNAWGALLESAVTVLVENSDAAKTSGGETGSGAERFPLGGKSPRVDFALQPLIIDNEYISAVTAHSSYWTNQDVQDFVVGLLTAFSVSTTNNRNDNTTGKLAQS